MQQVTVWLRYTRILMTLVKNYCSDYYNVESSGDLANTLDCLAGSKAQIFVTQFCKSPTENHISLIMLRPIPILTPYVGFARNRRPVCPTQTRGLSTIFKSGNPLFAETNPPLTPCGFSFINTYILYSINSPLDGDGKLYHSLVSCVNRAICAYRSNHNNNNSPKADCRT